MCVNGGHGKQKPGQPCQPRQIFQIKTLRNGEARQQDFPCLRQQKALLVCPAVGIAEADQRFHILHERMCFQRIFVEGKCVLPCSLFSGVRPQDIRKF